MQRAAIDFPTTTAGSECNSNMQYGFCKPLSVCLYQAGGQNAAPTHAVFKDT
jgi:hypothetical protein